MARLLFQSAAASKTTDATASRRSRSRIAALCAAAVLSAAMVPSGAHAVDFKLPAGDYGKVVLPLRQSLGDAARDVVDRQNVFEPIGLLRDDDPMRQVARAVGRLDLKIEENGQEFLSTCTATIVEGNLVLTNYHCIPGFTGRVIEASLLLDYYGPDSQTTRISVETTPLEKNADLDYSLSRLAGPPPAGLLPIPFSRQRSRPLERLTIVHHPAGQPKMMTQFRCYAADSQADGPKLRHRCDTLPGSSGAPIFNSERQVVGIHHTGGLNENDPNSFNEGSNVTDILAGSARLRDSQGPASGVAGSKAPGTPGGAVSAARPAPPPQTQTTGQTAMPPKANDAIGGSDRAKPYNDLLGQ